MKTYLNEKELRIYIHNKIKGMLGLGYYEDWLNTRKFKIVTKGLTEAFEPNRMKRLVERKYDLASIGAKVSIFGEIKQCKALNPIKCYNKSTEIILTFTMGYGLTKCDPDMVNNIMHTFDACGWMFVSVENVNTCENYKDMESCIYSNKFIAYNIHFKPKFGKSVLNYE